MIALGIGQFSLHVFFVFVNSEKTFECLDVSMSQMKEWEVCQVEGKMWCESDGSWNAISGKGSVVTAFQWWRGSWASSLYPKWGMFPSHSLSYVVGESWQHEVKLPLCHVQIEKNEVTTQTLLERLDILKNREPLGIPCKKNGGHFGVEGRHLRHLVMFSTHGHKLWSFKRIDGWCQSSGHWDMEILEELQRLIQFVKYKCISWHNFT